MPGHRSASFLLAAVLAPAGCAPAVLCGDAGPLCLATDAVTHVRVGFLPDALVLADVDRDGARDLVAASSRAGTLTVLWADAAGLTDRATTWSIDQEVAGVVAADLDGDGHPDLATALPRADAVAVVRGRGGRSFADPERHPAGAVPRALIAADLDGRGPPELVTGNLGDGTVSVLRGFVADPPTVVGPGPRALAAGDLDSDGHVDVAVALADADVVQVLRGDGDGGLWPAALHPVGAAPRDIVVADLDADGHLDLATADSLDDTVSVLWGDGAGDLRGRTSWPTEPLPLDLVVSAPDDSSPVLAVLSEETSTVERLDPRSGDRLAGVLATAPGVLADDAGALVSAGEAVSSLSPGTGLIMTELRTWAGVHMTWPVDLDSDGVDELVLRAAGEIDTLTIGDADPPVQVHLEGSYLEMIGGADLDGDGAVDLLVRAGDELRTVLQRPGGAWEPATPLAIPDAQDIDLADLDADGVTEVLVLVRGEAADSRLDIYRSDDAGALILVETRSFTVDDPPHTLRVIDGDGDDAPDLLLSSYSLHHYLEDARGPLVDLGWISGSVPYDFVPTDLDGDGRLDAVSCDERSVDAYFDLFGEYKLPEELFEARCDDIELLDLDRDGDLDILVIEDDPYDDITRLVPWVFDAGEWRSGGARSFTNSYVFEHVRAELDGDGVPELIVADGNDTRAFHLDFGPTLVETEHVRLNPHAGLRFGDLDGDGAADLLAFGDSVALARGDGRGGFGPLSHFDANVESPQHAPIVEGMLVARGDHGAQFVWTTRHPEIPTDLLRVADVTLTGLRQPHLVELLPGSTTLMFDADLDGDGVRDVVAFGLQYGFSGLWYRGRDDGRIEDGEPLALDREIAVKSVGIYDMNRDGHLDLVASYFDRQDVQGTRVYFGASDGDFTTGEEWSDLWPPLWERTRLLFGDFDRDGQVDVVAENGGSQLLLVPGATRSPRVLFDTVSAYAAADLDRDGYPELLVARPDAFAPDSTRLHVGRSRSDGSFGFVAYEVATSGVREIQTAYVDGDDALDIILVDNLGATIVRQVP